MTRWVRPGLLFAETTRADWGSLYKGVKAPTTGQLSPVRMLRWALHPDLGLPTGPFTIWQRNSQSPGVAPVPLPGAAVTASPQNPRDIPLPVAAMRVSLTVATPSGALTLDAFDAGGTRITGRTISQGASGLTVVLTGSGIARVRASGAGQVTSGTCIPAAAYANLPDWSPLETVGLPVVPLAGLPYSTAAQGLTAAPASPADAALQRLKRAAPQAGWPEAVGFSGPAWAPPDGAALVGAYQQTLITDLMGMLTTVGDPTRHAAYRTTTTLPQPQDQLGGTASSAALGDSSASVPPLGVLALACHGDLYAALALGFATGYPSPEPDPAMAAPAMDFMVTVKHAFSYPVGPVTVSLDGELAAFFAPSGAARPPAPSALAAAPAAGGSRPAGRDKPRVCSVRVGWDRGDTMAGSMQAVSAAVARALPSGAVSLLVNTRQANAPVPFVAAVPVHPVGDQATRVTFTDGVFPDLSEPSGSYTYLVCGQNRWGMWGDWAQAPLSPPAEAAQQPLIVGVGLELADPQQVAATGNTRAAVLTIDLSWDWHDRSPAGVEVIAAYLDPASPPPTAPPAPVFDPLGSPASLTLAWTEVSGSVQDPPQPSMAGATVTRAEPVPAAGDHTPPDEVGRYRLTVPVTLDFAAGDVRVACWIRGTERMTGLTSDWTAPALATVRSPVPPLPPGPPGPLTWASLPDATGRSRAHLTWAATPGAVSYAVYHADETALLAAAGQPPPDLSQPLSQRKSALDAAVRIESARDGFLRVTPDPVTDTQYDVELPRGSQVLHGFVVLARSASGVESAWPATPPASAGGRGYTLMGIPRPRVPRPPALSVTAASATSVTVRVTTPAGVVDRVDLHRTALARLSGDVGTMGPPIATLAPAAGGQIDTVAPSWQPYWYRAVAWGAADDDNGWRPAPGPASAAQKVLVPPATPPAVTGARIVPVTAGAPSYVTFTTDAPPIVTGLGRFALRVAVTTMDTAQAPAAQAVLNTTLDAIGPGGSGPPAADTGVLVGPAWLAPDGSIGVVLNPPPGDTVASVRISVTDPRGRSQPEPTEVKP